MNETKEKSAEAERLGFILSHGGRRPFAVFLDAAIFGSAAFTALYFAVRPRFSDPRAALALSLGLFFAGVPLYIAGDRALSLRRIEKHRRSAREAVASRKLLASSKALLESIPDSPTTAVSLSVDSLTADEVLRALSLPSPFVSLVAAAKPTPAAEALIADASRRLRTVSPYEYLGISPEEAVAVSEEETDAELIKKHSALLKRPSVFRGLAAFSRERAAKFVWLGAGLLIASFFVRYPLYYRAAASAVMSFGGYLLIAGRYRKAPEDGSGAAE